MSRDLQDTLRRWGWYTAGAHLLFGCAWPLLGRRSHAKIMGRKQDRWLMDTVALIFGATGTTIARATARDRITPEIARLAIGASASIIGVEAVNVARGRIPPTNLVDTLGHVTIVAGWVSTLVRRDGENEATSAMDLLERYPSQTPNPLMRLVAKTQAVYFVPFSIWGLSNIHSFMWVTGKKEDVWLVKTVCLLLIVIGSVTGRAGAKDRVTPEIAALGIGASGSLAAIDLWYAGVKGRISKVYLLDALANSVLIAGWIAASKKQED